MQSSLANRLSNIISLGAGAAGVSWSGPEYRWIFEWIFYLSVLWAVVSICREGWSNRVTLIGWVKKVEPSHVIILGLAIALCGVIWQMRQRSPTGEPAVKQSVSQATSNQSAPSLKVSDFEWGFERYPGYDFIGMSAAPDGQILVQQFQAQGFNRTNDPIVNISGVVRSDRTNKEFPILYNLADGKLRTSAEIDPIPVNAIVDARAYLSDDQKPIPLKQFLSQVVPFTFIIQYDGKSYRHTFTLSDIEPRIQRYEQDLRKMSAAPPQMSAKKDSTGNLQESSAPLLPRDVQKLLEALGEAAYLSEKSITPTLGAIDSWAANWRGLLRNGNGEVVYVTGRDSLQREVWDKIDALLAKYPTYQTQLQGALALEIPAAKNELSRALEDAIITVKKYPKNTPPDMDELMEPRFKELIKQSNLAWSWWSEARQRITEMTANLKNKGAAEYAKR
jgi:hypothetical protein